MRKNTIVRATAALWAILLAALVVNQSNAVQNSCIMPTSGTVSGLTLVNNINGCYGSILSLYSGASAPASPSAGMLWLDTSTTPNNVRQYDGGAWTLLWTVDATNHLIVRGIGSGTATLASATTTDLGSLPQPVKQISGTTTISSFGSSATLGSLHVITFQNTLTIVRNAVSLILPGSTNIVTQAGDTAIASYLGGGNWQIISYNTASGAPVVNSALPLGTVLFGDYGTIPPKTVYGLGQALSRASYPAYFAAVTRAQSVTLTTGNNTLTSVPNTDGLGVGMPLEGSGIPNGATIASVTSNTIVMSTNATLSGVQSVTAFVTGYGSGGDTTTVGVKNCKGRAVVGRDNMGGIVANNLPGLSAINTSAGSATGTLLQSDLPNASLSASVTTTQAVPTVPQQIQVPNGSFYNPWVGGSYGAVTSTGQTSSLNGNVTQTAYSKVQSTVGAECVVVVQQ